MSRRVFLVAGEPSGDRLGASLMTGLTRVGGPTGFSGVGGPEMENCGLASLFDFSKLSVMGLVEVVGHLPSLVRLVGVTAEAALAERPDVMVTIDSPDFCLRVARRVRARGGNFPIIHYVSPSVWAWRTGRARKLADAVDHVLALLPFEPDFLAGHGVDASFVGHPAADQPGSTMREDAWLRNEIGADPDRPILAVLPGSRRSEIEILAPVFGQAVSMFCKRRPDFQVIVPAAAAVAARLEFHLEAWPAHTHVIDPRGMTLAEGEGRKVAVLQLADLALAASGTVALELAMADTPMVVAYDMKWISRQLIGSLLKVETVSLVNLVDQSATVPEMLGKSCRADLICNAIEALATDLQHQRQQRQAFARVREKLGAGDEPSGVRAARAVLDVIARNRQARPRTPSPDLQD